MGGMGGGECKGGVMGGVMPSFTTHNLNMHWGSGVEGVGTGGGVG